MYCEVNCTAAETLAVQILVKTKKWLVGEGWWICQQGNSDVLLNSCQYFNYHNISQLSLKKADTQIIYVPNIHDLCKYSENNIKQQ